MKKYYASLIFLAILFSAVVLRFSPPLFDRDYWYDEAFTGILLKASWSQMNQMIFADVHPPLYYWLAKAWAGLFHYSPAGIRSFSLLCGIAGVVSIFWIGKKMFNERAGLLAAAIVAISPFAIEYSQEARMYALFGLLMLWAVWFFYQALQSGKLGAWVGWGIFSGLSFYTHYLSLFFFLLFYAAYLLVTKEKLRAMKKGTVRQSQPAIKKLFLFFLPQKGFWLGTGIIVLFFLSWAKIFTSHISKGNLGWIEPAQLADLPKTLQIFFFGHPAGTGGVPWANEFRFFFDGTSAGLIIFSLILVLFSLSWIRKIKRQEILLLATISFGTLLLLILLSHGIDLDINGQVKNISVKLYVARYFMPAAMLVYLLLAGLLTEVFDGRIVWISFLAVYALLILSLKPMDYSSGWNLLFQGQQDLLTKNALIVTANPFDYSTARYYFGSEQVRYYNKNNPTEDFSGWVVVGNENRITDFEEIRKNTAAYILDNNCNWEGKQMIELAKLDQLSLCKAW